MRVSVLDTTTVVPSNSKVGFFLNGCCSTGIVVKTGCKVFVQINMSTGANCKHISVIKAMVIIAAGRQGGTIFYRKASPIRFIVWGVFFGHDTSTTEITVAFSNEFCTTAQNALAAENNAEHSVIECFDVGCAIYFKIVGIYTVINAVILGNDAGMLRNRECTKITADAALMLIRLVAITVILYGQYGMAGYVNIVRVCSDAVMETFGYG